MPAPTVINLSSIGHETDVNDEPFVPMYTIEIDGEDKTTLTFSALKITGSRLLRFRVPGPKRIVLLVHAAERPKAFLIEGETIEKLRPLTTPLPEIWRLETVSPIDADGVLIEPAKGAAAGLILTASALPGALAHHRLQSRPSFWDRHVFIVFYALFIVIALNLLLRSQILNDTQKGTAVILTSLSPLVTALGVRFSASFFRAPYERLAKQVGTALLVAFSGIAAVLGAAYLQEPVQCLYRSYQYERQIFGALRAGNTDKQREHALAAVTIAPNRLEGYAILSKLMSQIRASTRDLERDFAVSIRADSATIERIADFLNGDMGLDCSEFVPSEEDYIKRQIISWLFYVEEASYGYRDGVNDGPADGTGRIPPETASFEPLLENSIKQAPFFKLRRALYDAERIDYSILHAHYVQQRNRSAIDPNEYPWTQAPPFVTEVPDKITTIFNYIYDDADTPSTYTGIRRDFASDYVVFLAQDKILRFVLLTCNFTWVRNHVPEMLHRRQEMIRSERIWIFSPDAEDIFRLFRSIRDDDRTLWSETYLPAYNLNQNLSKCDNFGDPGANAVPDGNQRALMIQQLKSDFPTWLHTGEKEWFRNTVDGLTWPELSTHILDQAKADWRY